MVPQLSPVDTPVAEHKQGCLGQLELFPHLTNAEFDEACSTLLRRFEMHGRRQVEWNAVESLSSSETTYLRITKPLALQLDLPGTGDDNEEAELREDDDEVAETPASSRAVSHYDVVLSPAYRVPVLYFSISDTLHRYPPTMEMLYSALVPPAFKAQAEHVGVIGGITITDHPVTNKPVFFIHPCRTAEVMEASVGGRNITAYDYLLLWIGAFGKCVGLNVPLTLVDRKND
ncbi:uncharacterized protein M421DRAFT_4254 [Didymella exigua CBS 183.55]|uniref:Ubiquitin-like-conjugating enzyme ATG10 n=1 Tax=Didymella exigua CBS 183.55 TaxID=1150837 RepID=A0A6A5RR55_9PLEO|nr:uncharacterized protein M421DRAFT_4254 [Didymella exigua CBS 183.55]KAF1929820.1 hypothetical protein M421DRAFT_4254 [Didymella exigua CBS 183.55]